MWTVHIGARAHPDFADSTVITSVAQLHTHLFGMLSFAASLPTIDSDGAWPKTPTPIAGVFGLSDLLNLGGGRAAQAILVGADP